MSRYLIAEDEHLEVVVGWDPPLGTFFCQVFDNTVSEDEDECIVWLGAERGELPTTTDLIVKMTERGLPVLHNSVLNDLAKDQTEPWLPGPMQKALGFTGKEAI